MSPASARWCRACGSPPVNGGPPWIAGVFVYRGRVVPVVDLHRLIGGRRMPAAPQQPDHPVAVSAERPGIAGRAAGHAGRRHPRGSNGTVAAGRRPARPIGLGPGTTGRAGILRILDPDCAARRGRGRIGRVDRRGGDRMSLTGIEAVVRDRLGLDPEALGAAALPLAVEKRSNAIGVATTDDYLAVVSSDPAEQIALAAELAVPETWFFRGGHELFDSLAEFISERPASARRTRRSAS